MAKFEQMILQDEYDACIKGCQTASCRNKDYFHFAGRNVKEEGRNVGAESRQTGDPLYSETYLGALVQAGVPSELLRLRGQSIGRGRRDADGGHARRGLSRRQGAAVDI